jgi:ABC-type Fe3+ transport system substrate-binding protein
MPTSGGFGPLYTVCLPTKPPNPNAAKLFMDFMLSTEGQNVCVEKLDFWALRPGMKSPLGLPSFDQLKLWTLDEIKANTDFNTLMGEWQRIMGLQ